MKTKILFLAIIANMYAMVNAQQWDSIAYQPPMQAVYNNAYSSSQGLIIGSVRGIWRLQNNTIDTLFYQSMPLIICSRFALSNDTVFLLSNGLKRFKIGEYPTAYSLPNVHDSIFANSNKLLIENDNHYYLTQYGIYHYNGVTTQFISQSLGVLPDLMSVDNNNKLYFYNQNKLYYNSANQSVVITDTLTNMKLLKVNLHTNDLYLLNHGKLYRYANSQLNEVVIENYLFDNFNYVKSISNVSFAKDRNYMYLKCQSSYFVYYVGVNPMGGVAREILKDFELLYANEITEFEGNVYAFSHDKVYYTTNETFNSQTAALGGNILNKGNFKAFIGSDGMFFRNTIVGNALFEMPKNSGKNLAASAGLWFMGVNDNHDTSLAAMRYAQIGRDFWAGPVGFNYNSEYDNKYNHVWVVTAEEVEYHRNNFQNPNYTIPESILTWPAHGNISNGEYAFLAPFVDVNENGFYEPNLGDYPIIYGVQTAYFLYNDARANHTESGGSALNLEIHGMAYVADSVDSDLKNAMFVKYNIYNKGENYSDFILGRFEDIDLEYDGDYVGCDTLRNTYYYYKGCFYDTTGTMPPPYLSVSLLSEDMDKYIYFLGGYTEMSMINPETYSDYVWAMKGMRNNGEPYTFGGNAYSGTEPVKYVFPGNPSVPHEWSEFSAQNPSNDRKSLVLTQNRSFNANSNYCFDLVYTYYGESTDLSDGILANYSGLMERVDKMKNYYDTANVSCFSSGLSFVPQPIPSNTNATYSNAYRYNTEIDYNMPIDSVSILQIIPINTYLTSISWGVYQNGNQYIFSNVEYAVQNNIPVVLTLNIMKNPNLKTTNSHSIKYYLHGIVGVSEYEKTNIKMYPNPSTSQLTFEGIETVTAIKIHDIMGRLVRIIDNKKLDNAISISIDDLKRGIYIVSFVNSNGEKIGFEKLTVN